MAEKFIAWAKKQPLIAFYILAFAITWLGWAPQAAYSRGLFPFDSIVFFIFGGIGPLLAVFITTRLLNGKSDFLPLFRPLFRWRLHPLWYVVALLGYPALWIVTLLINGQLNTELAKLGTPFVLLTTFLVAFVAAIPEEIAWRGFALPRLQARYPAVVSAIIVGVLWALWHLPLLLNLNNSMSAYPLLPYFLDVIGHSIVYAWLYNNTRGSLLFVTLFHAASNTVGPFGGWSNVVVTYAVVAVLIGIYGWKHLTRSGERPVQVDHPAQVSQAD